MKQVKNNLNLEFLLNLLKSNKKPIKISKELNISKQNLQYYLNKFKKEGIIKKIGYGTWEVKNMTLNTIKSKHKQIRGHAFIWTIKLNKQFDWLEFLKNTKFNLIRGLTPRLIIKNHKIWLGKKTITIYESRSFYGKNSIESRKYAVIGLIEVLEALQKELNINLKPYIFKPTREHYGMIKNDLARQYNRNNEKMIIKDDIEGEWLWIDDSESLGELETKNIIRSKQVQDWWNDNKKHDFRVTPSFLVENINQVTQNQLIFAKNMESHINAIQTLSKEVKRLSKVFKSTIKENKKYKLGSQRTIFDYF